MKPTIVFILSTNYAGSHFLSLLLGSNSRAMHIGEVKRLRKVGPGESSAVCYVCKDKGPCPVLSGIDSGNIDDVYRVIFSRIDPGITTLIDNSKTVSGWADRFLREDRYARKYIHLIRDPRAIIRRGILNNSEHSKRERWGVRWDVMKSAPSLALPVLFAREAEVYRYRWLARNQAITRFIEEHELDFCLLTYEDLATQTPSELRRVTEWIGLHYEPSQVEYWNFEHHGTQKPDYDWVKRTSHVDLRWQSFLQPQDIQRCCKDPGVNRYLAGLGIALTDDGLTRNIN